MYFQLSNKLFDTDNRTSKTYICEIRDKFNQNKIKFVINLIKIK